MAPSGTARRRVRDAAAPYCCGRDRGRARGWRGVVAGRVTVRRRGLAVAVSRDGLLGQPWRLREVRGRNRRSVAVAEGEGGEVPGDADVYE